MKPIKPLLNDFLKHLAIILKDHEVKHTLPTETIHSPLTTTIIKLNKN